MHWEQPWLEADDETRNGLFPRVKLGLFLSSEERLIMFLKKVDEQENPFDFKANEDTKQRNVSSAKDYYDGFYDNHQEDKKLSSEESVLNVNSVTPIPSPRKSSKEDPEQEKISSPDKGSLIERQNSFKTTQKFFQENGTIIEPKEYKKVKVEEPLETSSTKK